MSLKARINDDMKAALRAKAAERLKAIRLLVAAIKQREVDERIELGDAEIVTVIERMLKQRRESIAQFESAGRQDLADAERAEIDVLTGYMPQPLSAAELETLVAQAIAESGAKTPRDMGSVMALLRPRVAGRADGAAVAQLVKSRLSG